MGGPAGRWWRGTFPGRAARRSALVVLLCVAGATAAVAQRIWTGGGRFYREPPKWVKPADFDGSFLYCRGFYTSVTREAGGQGWSTDYPGADNNFSVRLAELTRVHVKLDEKREPNYGVVSLTDPLLYKCPMLFMEDVGTVEFSDAEVQALRTYLLKGGFLWVDDYWGSFAWDRWSQEIARVLTPDRFPIVEVPLTHPIMHTLYDVKEYLQVSSIQFWYSNSGATSERGPDSADVHYRGIEDAGGRLMVFMTHNTDVSDTWEREGESREYFDRFSPRGYAIGVNVVLYALTH
ncbi:MAG TPA: DUF4159 domain-containing protein [Vicinamibacterales bacterium]|nr:DUF4159 domain-containing protein [Vicinamibacterales bacterium]